MLAKLHAQVRKTGQRGAIRCVGRSGLIKARTRSNSFADLQQHRGDIGDLDCIAGKKTGRIQRVSGGIPHPVFHPGDIAEQQVCFDARRFALQECLQCNPRSDRLALRHVPLNSSPMTIVAHGNLPDLAKRPFVKTDADTRQSVDRIDRIPPVTEHWLEYGKYRLEFTAIALPAVQPFLVDRHDDLGIAGGGDETLVARALIEFQHW
jgi:hypothetical protein